MNGAPMISYVIKEALQSKITKEIYVNTDSSEIISYVEKNFSNNWGNTDNFWCPISHSGAKKWFKDLFGWLEKCENLFGFNELKGYETRLYGYLAERYLSFWFKKYTKYKEQPWIFIDN
jgi:hypothetical protein